MQFQSALTRRWPASERDQVAGRTALITERLVTYPERSLVRHFTDHLRRATPLGTYSVRRWYGGYVNQPSEGQGSDSRPLHSSRRTSPTHNAAPNSGRDAEGSRAMYLQKRNVTMKIGAENDERR